jgi:hypothetical protein
MLGQREPKIEKFTLYKMLPFLNPPIAYVAKNIGETVKRKRCHAMQNHELCSTSLHGRAGRGGGRHACWQNGPHISGGWIPSRNNIHKEDIPGTNPIHVPSKEHLEPCPLLPMTGKLATMLRNRNRNFLPQGNQHHNLITDLSGTGTIIKWNHKSSRRHNIKIVYLVFFI